MCQHESCFPLAQGDRGQGFTNRDTAVARVTVCFLSCSSQCSVYHHPHVICEGQPLVVVRSQKACGPGYPSSFTPEGISLGELLKLERYLCPVYSLRTQCPSVVLARHSLGCDPRPQLVLTMVKGMNGSEAAWKQGLWKPCLSSGSVRSLSALSLEVTPVCLQRRRANGREEKPGLGQATQRARSSLVNKVCHQESAMNSLFSCMHVGIFFT